MRLPILEYTLEYDILNISLTGHLYLHFVDEPC
jgi:hypothetical protein